MSSRAIDLTGQRFGKLKVIKRVGSGENRAATWLCQCDCGNKLIVLSTSLRSGHTTSCGCKNYKDLTGKRFGKLLVVRKIKNNFYGQKQWLCQCDCGKQKVYTTGTLTQGGTKSCGCFNKKIAKVKAKKMFDSEKDYFVEGTYLLGLNRRKNKNNTSGTTGVYFASREKVYIASITFKGKRHFLGRFKNKQDAINARKEAEEKYFKPILEKYKNSHSRQSD